MGKKKKYRRLAKEQGADEATKHALKYLTPTDVIIDYVKNWQPLKQGRLLAVLLTIGAATYLGFELSGDSDVFDFASNDPPGPDLG